MALGQEFAGNQPRHGRLIVLGLDALDWKLVDELVDRGLMPNVGRLMDRGAHAILHVPPPLISPVVWTTLATGVPPEVHGVLDFLEADPGDGLPRPVGSRSRKVPALWEMAAAAGRSSAVIGWWATFPAQGPPGCTIYSDRLTEQLLGLEGATPGVVAPAEAVTIARQLVVRGSSVTATMLEPFLEVYETEIQAVRSGDASWDDPVGGLAKLVAATVSVQRLTEYELGRGTEVILSYVEGTDTVGHLFAPYRPPPQPSVPETLARRFGSVVDRYHAQIDGWIGTVVMAMTDSDSLVIISDHGFTWGDDRPPAASGTHTATAVWWHRPEGVFLAVGPQIGHTQSRRHLDVLDVAPTLLAIAGLPPGDRMNGTVPQWLWSEAGGPHATDPVDYAELLPRRKERDIQLPIEAREEELAKLRALGYIADSGRSAVVARTRVDRTEARRLNNLGLTRFSSEDLEGAEEIFLQAIANDPSYAAPHYNLSLLYRRKGRFEEADREFWKSVESGIADREMAVVRLALDYRERGDAQRALAVFLEGQRRFPASGKIWLNAGVFFGQNGQYPEAVRSLRRAAELDPTNPRAHANLAVALLAMGQTEAAREALTEANKLNPLDEAIRSELERLGGPTVSQ